MIQEKFMRELYVRTIQQYSRQPNDEEFRAWMDVLGENSYADVDAALRRWSGNTSIEFSGRVSGARMPSPAELKASIQSFDRSQSDRFISCGQCEAGWVRTFEGKTVAGNAVDKKIGAVKRCECFFRWLAYKSSSTAPGHPQLVSRDS